MKKRGKICAIVLGLATACSCVGLVACEEMSVISKEEISYTLSDDGTYYIIKGSGWNKGSSLTVPDLKGEIPVREIAARGFEGEWLTKLKTGDTLEKIGERAFYTCWELSEVEIGANVTEIGDLAFASCVELDKITVSAQNTAYVSLNGNLYDAQMTTLVQYAVGKSDEVFILPETVTTIEDKALADSMALKAVVIDAAVTSIGTGAFSIENISGELEVGVERFYYAGQQSDWKNVAIGENNGHISEETVYFYSSYRKSGKYWRYVDGVPKAWDEE